MRALVLFIQRRFRNVLTLSSSLHFHQTFSTIIPKFEPSIYIEYHEEIVVYRL
jgi:hypothetical protein